MVTSKLHIYQDYPSCYNIDCDANKNSMDFSNSESSHVNELHSNNPSYSASLWSTTHKPIPWIYLTSPINQAWISKQRYTKSATKYTTDTTSVVPKHTLRWPYTYLWVLSQLH